jgi:hypothetical protein
MFNAYCVVLFCLSSSFAWWWPTCIMFFVLFCLDEDKQNKTKNTIHVGHHHAKDEDKQNKQKTRYMLVTTMQKTKTNCFLFCFVCLRLLHGGDQHVLCFWFVFFAFVLCLVNQILLVSLDCIFLITSSVSLTFNYIESPVFSSKACRVHPFTSNPLWTRLFKVISWQSCVRLFYFTTYCIS